MPSPKPLPSLQGCRVALTIAADAAHSPAEALSEREAAILYYPVSQTLPPDSYDELDAALRGCKEGTVDWLLLTTPCAVEAVAERLAHLGIDQSELSNAKIASYGARTHQTLTTHLPALQSAITTHQSHDEIVSAMQLDATQTVAVPLPQRTRSDWHQLLTSTGANAIIAPAYRLILGRGGDDLPGALWGGLVDVVVFLTENSVRHFVIRLKAEGGSLDMLGDVIVACLDPQTAAAAKAYNFNVQVSPTVHTADALAEALAHYFSDSRVRLPGA
jgi:uroporphyrinogen-III synthase